MALSGKSPRLTGSYEPSLRCFGGVGPAVCNPRCSYPTGQHAVVTVGGCHRSCNFKVRLLGYVKFLLLIIKIYHSLLMFLGRLLFGPFMFLSRLQYVVESICLDGSSIWCGLSKLVACTMQSSGSE